MVIKVSNDAKEENRDVRDRSEAGSRHYASLKYTIAKKDNSIKMLSKNADIMN